MTALSIVELRSFMGSRLRSADDLQEEPREPCLRLDWSDLDSLLPDGGLPRGVVEIASPEALGGGSTIALAAVRAAHLHDRAWCAWIDADATLYAPGLHASGVDLKRLFVVRPPRADVARVSVKVANAAAFEVIVIDVDPAERIPGAAPAPRSRKKAWPVEVLVRKLALAAASGGATIILLTDSTLPRAVPWPVALRLELERDRDSILVRVAKEKRGRTGLARTIPLESRPTLARDRRAG